MGTAQSLEHKITAEGAQHHDVAMGEIDHEKNAVYQRISNGDDSVDTAQDQPGDRKMQPGVRPVNGMGKDRS